MKVSSPLKVVNALSTSILASTCWQKLGMAATAIQMREARERQYTKWHQEEVLALLDSFGKVVGIGSRLLK